ncbi:hypothetical protein LBMAG53_36360 [Planctomycetota bacterium]|nr:hypothetical protein LBMAG53_36360 [Planctomycetota bacterium]
MAAELRHHPTAQARLVGLFRLLLVALALAAVAGFLSTAGTLKIGPAAEILQTLLIGVSIAAGVLVVVVRWVNQRWQLALHLVFDLLWIGGVLLCTGGPSSPGVALLFAVVLIGNLVLPGVAPFLLPALAGLVLAVVASLYLARNVPLSPELLNVQPELVSQSRVLGYLAVQVVALFLVDLLAQVLARRTSEQRIFADEVLDQLAEGVLAIDRQGVVVYLNAEAIRLLDLHRQTVPAAELVGLQASAAIPGDGLRPALNLLRDPRCPAMQRLDHLGRNLVLRVSPLTSRKAVIGRILLIADETRLRVLQNSAHRAERMASLGEMAAGIAHEVRNPLTSLRGCAQELAEISARGGDRDAADLAGILVGESDRIARIVEDFLAFSRQRPPVRQSLDVGRVVLEQKTLLGGRNNLPKLQVEVEVAPDTPAAWADSDQIRQVVTNLVANALDALADIPEPRLTLRSGQAGEDGPLGAGSATISVADNGCGIPFDQQERVFAPFYSTKAQGTGLGLSLVTRIIREHEGVVQLASSPGIGTTITIHLPAVSQTREYRRALGGGGTQSNPPFNPGSGVLTLTPTAGSWDTDRCPPLKS